MILTGLLGRTIKFNDLVNFTLSKSFFNLANQTRCSKDNIIVRDGENMKGRILKLICSNSDSVTTVESSGNVMFIQLKTSDRLRTGGFKAEWTAKDIQKEGK